MSRATRVHRCKIVNTQRMNMERDINEALRSIQMNSEIDCPEIIDIRIDASDSVSVTVMIWYTHIVRENDGNMGW